MYKYFTFIKVLIRVLKKKKKGENGQRWGKKIRFQSTRRKREKNLIKPMRHGSLWFRYSRAIFYRVHRKTNAKHAIK